MICAEEERLLKILRAPHVSEKASTAIERNNTIIFKVFKNATKTEIKIAIQKLFEVEVKNINTLLVKGKTKCHYSRRVSYHRDWKKAYITLKEGQNINFISGVE